MFESKQEILETLRKHGNISEDTFNKLVGNTDGDSCEIKNFSTAELVEELKDREGVEFDVLNPEDSYELCFYLGEENGLKRYFGKDADSGPCTIFIIRD